MVGVVKVWLQLNYSAIEYSKVMMDHIIACAAQEDTLSHIKKGDFVASIHKLEVCTSLSLSLSLSLSPPPLPPHDMCVKMYPFPLQLDRVRYVLCSYLRNRVQKVC